jgi:hypothetical protein
MLGLRSGSTQVEHMVTDSDIEGSNPATVWHKEKLAVEKWLIVEAKQPGHTGRAHGYWFWHREFKSGAAEKYLY